MSVHPVSRLDKAASPGCRMAGWTRSMLALVIVVVAWSFMLPQTSAQAAALRVDIDLSAQKMRVKLDGRTLGIWSVSTARAGYRTPKGSFSPKRLEAKWYSRKYHNSPMPHSIFFLGGYAIHGTTAIRRLGRPASHGCVRLHPDNARVLFGLVRRYGASNTLITIHQ